MTPKTVAVAVILYLYRAWRGLTEPFRLDRTPAWITLAIAAVSIPLLIWRLSHGFTAGDFGTVVLTATLIALIWTAHYTFRAVRHARQVEERENARRGFSRQSMAVGVMAELDYLNLSLALMRSRIAVRGVRFLERPQLRHALSHIDMFSRETATRLSQFDSILRQIESHVALYEADFVAANYINEKGWFGASRTDLLAFDTKRVEDIRTLIEGATIVIPHLLQQLLQEG